LAGTEIDGQDEKYHGTRQVIDPTLSSERRNLYRSLFVLDRFIGTVLGRALHIDEHFVSKDVLQPPKIPNGVHEGVEPAHLKGLDASVRICWDIGLVLRDIYPKSQIYTSDAHRIKQAVDWKSHESLSHDPLLNINDPTQSLAILHASLFHLQLHLLLYRPYLLFSMWQRHASKGKKVLTHPIPCQSRLWKYSNSCVRAAYATVGLVKQVKNSGLLPPRDPFVMQVNFCFFFLFFVVFGFFFPEGYRPSCVGFILTG
jgi:hypothetical protein